MPMLANEYKNALRSFQLIRGSESKGINARSGLRSENVQPGKRSFVLLAELLRFFKVKMSDNY